VLSPEEAEEIREGDYVYFLAPPEKAQALDRFFVDAPPPSSPDTRLLGDFYVPGDATLGALGEIYGLSISSEDASVTLAERFNAQFHGAPKVGDRIQVGPIQLIADQVIGGRVTTVGLDLAEPDKAENVRRSLKGRLSAARKKAFARLKRF
jgi:cell volume regulation protein A